MPVNQIDSFDTHVSPELMTRSLTCDRNLFAGSISISRCDAQCFSSPMARIARKLYCVFSGYGSSAGEPRGSDSRSHSDEAKEQAPRCNPCLLVPKDGSCVGGIRRTSLPYQIIRSLAVLLFSLLAGYGAPRAFSSP